MDSVNQQYQQQIIPIVPPDMPVANVPNEQVKNDGNPAEGEDEMD